MGMMVVIIIIIIISSSRNLQQWWMVKQQGLGQMSSLVVTEGGLGVLLGVQGYHYSSSSRGRSNPSGHPSGMYPTSINISSKMCKTMGTVTTITNNSIRLEGCPYINP
jgi:hypothetical protein